MELNTSGLPVFVQLAPVIFEKAKAEMPTPARTSGLFVVESIPQGSGNTRQYTEIDLETFATVKGESDQAARAQVQQGYTKTMTTKRFAKDIGISYEMRTQNKYQEVVRRLTNLAGLAVQRLELDLQHRLTFGTATTYVNKEGETIDIALGDTYQLFYTAHTLNGSSTTFRNRLANNPKLSKGALEGMERLIVEETYNHLGEKKTQPFDILWTTDDPNTVNTAREYLQSTAAVEATNAGVTNVYRSKYRHVILPYVATDKNGAVDSTKRYYWGLASSMTSTAHVGIWEEPHLKMPSDLNAGEEFSTDDWNFGVRAGWGIAIVEGSWIKFSSGDGTA